MLKCLRVFCIAYRILDRWPASFVFAVYFVLGFSSAQAQLVPGSMDVHWNMGAQDCSKEPQPPLQVHIYNARTFILRESLCATFEAPFMYLLVGTKKALLIDTGDVAEADRMPLAKTVVNLLPESGAQKPGLLVVHTHRHLDHRSGDGQFTNLPGVQVVEFDIGSVQRFYDFSNQPGGIAQIDLGDRTVDVIPTPGHDETEVSFYDRDTGLFFSGDFLMPGRLLIDDYPAERASANRVADFVKDRPISFVLGGHIEMDNDGKLFPWQSQYHPHEHVLPMTKQDLLALPNALSSFNGFYTQSHGFVFINSIHTLILSGVLLLLFLGTIVVIVVRRLRIRSRRKRSAEPMGAHG